MALLSVKRLANNVLPFKKLFLKSIQLFCIYLFNAFYRLSNKILLIDNKNNVLFLSEPLSCDGLPPVCTLGHTSTESKSNQMEAEVAMLVEAPLFFTFCIF